LYDVNPDVVEDGDNPDDIESNNNQESDTEVKTELWSVSSNLFIFPHHLTANIFLWNTAGDLIIIIYTLSLFISVYLVWDDY